MATWQGKSRPMSPSLSERYSVPLNLRHREGVTSPPRTSPGRHDAPSSRYRPLSSLETSSGAAAASMYAERDSRQAGGAAHIPAIDRIRSSLNADRHGTPTLGSGNTLQSPISPPPPPPGRTSAPVGSGRDRMLPPAVSPRVGYRPTALAGGARTPRDYSARDYGRAVHNPREGRDDAAAGFRPRDSSIGAGVGGRGATSAWQEPRQDSEQSLARGLQTALEASHRESRNLAKQLRDMKGPEPIVSEAHNDRELNHSTSTRLDEMQAAWNADKKRYHERVASLETEISQSRDSQRKAEAAARAPTTPRTGTSAPVHSNGVSEDAAQVRRLDAELKKAKNIHESKQEAGHAKLVEAQATIHALQSELRALKDQAAQQTSNRDRMDEEISKSRTKNSGLAYSLEAANQRVETLQMEVDKARRNDDRTTVEALKAEVRTLKEKAHVAERECEAAKKRSSALSHEANEQHEALMKAKSEIAEGDARVRDVRAQLSEKTAEAQRHREIASQARQAAMSASREKLVSLEDQCAQLSRQRDLLETEGAEARNEVEILRTKSEHFERRVQELADQLEESRQGTEDASHLKQRLRSRDEEIDGIQQRLNQQRLLAERNATRTAAAEAELCEVRQQLNSAHDATRSHDQEARSLSAQLGDLQQQVEEKHRLLAEAESGQQDLQRQLQALEERDAQGGSAVASAQAELDASRAQLAEAEQQCAQLRDQHDHGARRLQDYEKTIQDLEERLIEARDAGQEHEVAARSYEQQSLVFERRARDMEEQHASLAAQLEISAAETARLREERDAHTADPAELSSLEARLQAQGEELRQKEDALRDAEGTLQHRDAALRQMDATLREKDELLLEKDNALRAVDEEARVREGASLSQDETLRQKDEALGASAAALREAQEALRQRDEALQRGAEASKEQEALLLSKDAELQSIDQAVREKDALLQQKEEVLREAQDALRQKDEALLSTEASLRDVDGAAREREASLRGAEEALQQERDNAAQLAQQAEDLAQQLAQQEAAHRRATNELMQNASIEEQESRRKLRESEDVAARLSRTADEQNAALSEYKVIVARFEALQPVEEEKAQQLDSRVTDLVTQLQDAHQENRRLAEEHSAAAAGREATAKLLAEKEADLEATATSSQGMQVEVQRLEAEVEDYKVVVQRFESLKDAEEEHARRLQERVATMEAELRTRHDQVAELQQALDESKSALETAGSTAADAGATQQALEARVQELEDERDQQGAANDALSSALTHARTQNDHLMSDMEALQAESDSRKRDAAAREASAAESLEAKDAELRAAAETIAKAEAHARTASEGSDLAGAREAELVAQVQRLEQAQLAQQDQSRGDEMQAAQLREAEQALQDERRRSQGLSDACAARDAEAQAHEEALRSLTESLDAERGEKEALRQAVQERGADELPAALHALEEERTRGEQLSAAVQQLEGELQAHRTDRSAAESSESERQLDAVKMELADERARRESVAAKLDTLLDEAAESDRVAHKTELELRQALDAERQRCRALEEAGVGSRGTAPEEGGGDARAERLEAEVQGLAGELRERDAQLQEQRAECDSLDARLRDAMQLSDGQASTIRAQAEALQAAKAEPSEDPALQTLLQEQRAQCDTLDEKLRDALQLSDEQASVIRAQAEELQAAKAEPSGDTGFEALLQEQRAQCDLLDAKLRDALQLSDEQASTIREQAEALQASRAEPSEDAALQALLQDRERELADAAAREQTLRAECDALLEAQAAAADTSDPSIARRLEAENEALIQGMEEQHNHVRELQTECTALQLERVDAQRTIDHLRSSMQHMQDAEADAMQHVVDRAEEELHYAEEAAEMEEKMMHAYVVAHTHRAEYEAAAQGLRRAEGRISEVELAAASLATKCATTERKNMLLEESCHSLEGSLREQRSQPAPQPTPPSDPADRSAEHLAELQEAEGAAASFALRVGEVETENQTLRGTVASLQREERLNEQRISSLREELREVELQNESLQEMLVGPSAACPSEAAAFTAEVEQAEKERQQAVEAANQAQAEVFMFAQRVAELEKCLYEAASPEQPARRSSAALRTASMGTGANDSEFSSCRDLEESTRDSVPVGQGHADHMDMDMSEDEAGNTLPSMPPCEMEALIQRRQQGASAEHHSFTSATPPDAAPLSGGAGGAGAGPAEVGGNAGGDVAYPDASADVAFLSTPGSGLHILCHPLEQAQGLRILHAAGPHLPEEVNGL